MWTFLLRLYVQRYNSCDRYASTGKFLLPVGGNTAILNPKLMCNFKNLMANNFASLVGKSSVRRHVAKVIIILQNYFSSVYVVLHLTVLFKVFSHIWRKEEFKVLLLHANSRFLLFIWKDMIAKNICKHSLYMLSIFILIYII